MNLYRVKGTIEVNFETFVEAVSEEEAEKEAKSFAEELDVEITDCVDAPEIHWVELESENSND